MVIHFKSNKLKILDYFSIQYFTLPHTQNYISDSERAENIQKVDENW